MALDVIAAVYCVRIMQTLVRRQVCLRGGNPPQRFQRRVPLSQLRVQGGAVVSQQRAGRLDVGRRALVYKVLCEAFTSSVAHPQTLEHRLSVTVSVPDVARSAIWCD